MAQKSKPEVGTRKDGGALTATQAGIGYLRRADGWNAFFAAAGWHNQNTGRGMQAYDRNLATSFAPKRILPENVLRAMYRGDGLAKRVIELPTEAMTSKGFEIDGDPDGMIVARMEETGILKGLEAMVRWSRLFGGCLGIIGADDGHLYERPLVPERVRNVHYLHVYNRWRITFTSADLYQDPQHPKFGTPEFYWVQPLMGKSFRVHETRTIRMDGAPVDDLTAWLNQGWGDSYLQAAFDDLRQVASVYDSAEGILDDFVTETLSLKGLADLIGTEGGEAVILKRLEIIAKSRHVTNARLLDGDNEAFNKVASSVAGVPDIMDRFVKKLAATTGIPVTLLMGEAPAGLNATGEADLTNWDNKVMAYQDKDLKPCVETLARLIFLSRDGYFNGKEPENWTIKFKPLRPMSATAEANLDKVKVDTANSLVDRGILSEDEVRNLPEIRKRYGLPENSPAPGLPDPILLPLGGGKGGDPDDDEDKGDPDDPGKDDDKEKEKGKGEEDEEKGDSMPEDPAEARENILTACRGLILDARGRRRADSTRFDAKTLVFYKDRFPTAEKAKAWARGHGFKADGVVETMATWRIGQRAGEDFTPRTERDITPVKGVEITLARVARG